MSEFLLLLLSMSLSGILPALLLFLLRPFLKRKLSRAWMYYIWCIVAFRMLLPFAPRQNLAGVLFAEPAAVMRQSASFLQETAAPPAVLTGKENADSSMDSASVTNGISEAEETSPSGNAAIIPPEAEALTVERTVFKSGVRNAAAESVSGILLALWLGIAVFLFLHKYVSSRAFLRRLYMDSCEVTDPGITACYYDVCAQLSVRRPPRLLSSPGADTAMLAGMLHPAVVLPDGLLSAAQEADMAALPCILRHELIHYKRKDVWFQWIFRLTACIHFFNPVSHAVCREVSRCCELACDEAVAKNMTSRERRLYGCALLDALERGGSICSDPVSASLCGNAKFIKERLDTIKMAKKKTTLIKVLTPVLTVGLCFSTFYLGAWAAPADSLREENFSSEKTTASPATLTAKTPSADSRPVSLSSRTPSASAQVQVPAGYTALRTESVSLESVKELLLSLSYEDVTIYPSSDNTLTYIFCGNNSWDYADDEITSLDRKNNALILKSGVYNEAWYHLSSRKWQPKLFLFLPADISADLSASIGSGSMKSTQAIAADSVSLKTASGSMNFPDISSRGKLAVSNASGSTKTGNLTCTEAELDNASGSFRINDVNAAVNGTFSNASGSLTAGNVIVGANATTSGSRCIIGNASGHTDIGNVTVSGSLILSTASGPTSLGQVSAADYTVSTASAGLKLAGLRGNGSLSCTSGSIKAGILTPTGPVSMDNGSGSIQVSIPENTGLEFSAGSIGSGSIDAFFPIPDKKSAAAASPVRYGNAPYYPITASTMSGSITLKKS